MTSRGNRRRDFRWFPAYLFVELRNILMFYLKTRLSQSILNCSCSGFGRRKRRVCNDSDFVILYDLTI
jgi:hypothetical protein